jgi:CDP-4-dehydro-6-deoxyglucose reductase, E3
MSGAVVVPEPALLEEPHRVAALERRTATIVELWLRPVAAKLEFLPGQYVLLEDRDLTVAPRSYSVGNAPRPDGLLSLLVTRVPGGQGSTWVHDRLTVGNDVAVSGPYGSFVDDPVSRAPALYLAAGSGLAPIRALLEAALAEVARPALTLVFSARTEDEVLDGERFAALDAEHSRFHFVRTLTRPGGPPPHGRIPAMLPDLCEDLDAHDVFIAGAPGFVAACAEAAERLGARPDRVRSEEFFVEP